TEALLPISNLTFTGKDFLTMKGMEGRFDRVIANPPFGHGININAHLQRMFFALAPGGILVSIIPLSSKEFFNTANRTVYQDLENWTINSDGSVTPLTIVKYRKEI